VVTAEEVEAEGIGDGDEVEAAAGAEVALEGMLLGPQTIRQHRHRDSARKRTRAHERTTTVATSVLARWRGVGSPDS
jgi:hypothetical protein